MAPNMLVTVMGKSDALSIELGRFVVDYSIDDVPTDVLEHARLLVLDSLGVTIGATRLKQARTIASYWQQFGGAPDATVPGVEDQLPLPVATYLNSYFANLLDYDDTYSGRAVGHPGATIIPPAIAVAEDEGADTRSLLEAILVGYEVSIRIGDAIMPTPERSQQVVGTGTWQIFGPAVAAAKLRDYSVETVADTLGMAAMNAPVPLVRKVGIASERFQWLKNNYGWAAMGGVVAADLAERGFLGSRDVFDGPTGFWRMAGSDNFDESVLRTPLKEWHAVRDVSFKPYSSCRWTHATADCIIELRENGLEPDAVDSITVNTFHEAANLNSVPETVFEAQFSLPFVAAVAFSGYEPGFDWLSQERIDDPEVRALMERVQVNADAEMSRWYETDGQMAAAVTVKMENGDEHVAGTAYPRGHPEKPIGPSAIEQKFRRLATPVIGESATKQLSDVVDDLAGDNEISELTGPLANSCGT